MLAAQAVSWQVLGDPDTVAPSLELPKQGSDSVLHRRMKELMGVLHYDGYLAASYGMVRENDSIRTGTLYIGPRYAWTRLKPGDVPEVILSRSGYRERDFTSSPLRINELQRLFDQIVSYSEANGFPFAAVWLDSVRVSGQQVHGTLTYDPGPEIVFDSLRLQGFTEVKTAWLMSYLNLVPGTRYDQEAVDRVRGRIRRLSFMKLNGEPTMTFQNESARLYLPVERVPSNRVDGVVGFLPNEENDGGLRVTGELDLSLANLFNAGKQLDLRWQRVKPLSQTLAVGYRHPNVLRSPIHFSGSFELLKEDSTFINRHFHLALGLNRGIHEFSVFTRLKRTRLLSGNDFEGITELPEIADLNVNYYGLEYNASLLEDGWSDNKGWMVEVRGALGDKEIRRNSDIPEEVYEGEDLKTLQVTGELDARLGLQAGRSSLWFIRAHAGFVEDDQLFLNDLFRLGGIRSFRGFTENNFFTSSFATLTLEYQLFFETFSYIFLFIDQGMIRNELAGTPVRYPTGFGAGLTLRTGGGDLQLAYALGRTAGQPVNFSLSKFHFGYIAKF